MALHLGIINKSSKVLCLSTTRLAPGQVVRVSTLYPTEDALKRDLSLQKMVARGQVEIRPCEFDRMLTLAETIAEVEAREAQEKAEQLAARRERDKQHRRNRSQVRARQERLRQMEREERQAKSEEKSELNLLALFEKTRKENMQRLVRERMESAAAKPVDVEVVTQPDNEFSEMEELFNETERLAELHDDPVQPEPAPEPEPTEPEQPEGLEALTDADLRKLLDLCEVKGREKIKKRASLIKAVEKLELTIPDIQELLSV